MKKIEKNRNMFRVGICASVMFLSACTTTNDAAVETVSVMPNAGSFSAERMKADVTFLADDLLRGRETGSEGHRIAANYVAAQFRQLGLAPYGDKGSYFQEVPMRTATLKNSGSKVSVTIDGDTTELALGDDFIMSGNVLSAAGSVSAPVVYVGYGIHAPNLGHDDLAGLDLEGKIVLAVSGAPKSFHTEIRAHHGSSKTKGQELLKRGAVGYVSILSKVDEKRRPFKSYKRYLGMKSFGWLPPESDPTKPKFEASATLSHDVAEGLFKTVGKTLDGALSATEGGEAGGFAVGAEITMKRESNHSDVFDTPNVIAVLEGSDPILKKEYVVLSAHLDHIGVSEHAKGDDKINNGAMDNATGIATMLEVARAYVNHGIKPRRSILLAAVTGEERGLLGAEYFAHYPTVAKGAMVANVNLDMPVLVKDFSHLVAFGADRSTIGPITAEAVGKIGVKMAPDPLPQEGLFTRSDHYRFVQQGVPSVFLATDFGDKGKTLVEFLSTKYHTPQDEVDQPIDFVAGAKFAYVNWLILSAIANGDEKPEWKEGDFFGETFGSK